MIIFVQKSREISQVFQIITRSDNIGLLFFFYFEQADVMDKVQQLLPCQRFQFIIVAVLVTVVSFSIWRNSGLESYC